MEGAYTFLHDRIQEAAYALISDDDRAANHLRIARLLAAHTPPEKRLDAIFDIVNQFNRGSTLMTSREECEQVAELNLMAGTRARAATAYASALNYLAAGEALLAEDSWERCYPLAFATSLRRAECEFLTGGLAAAEERLSVLARRATNLADRAAVACLSMGLYVTVNRPDRAIEICLDYLRSLGIVWTAHPTDEEVRQEYEEMQRQLGGRSAEALIDLPLMTDPEWRATMDVLHEATAPSFCSDANLFALVMLRMANISLAHGNCDASCPAYVCLGMVLRSRFGEVQSGFRFGQLSVDLVEKRGLTGFKARVYHTFGTAVVPWTQPLRSGRELMRRAFAEMLEIGDLTYAGLSSQNLISNMISSGDPLEDVQREAEAGLAFAHKARFGLVLATITGQLMLIRALRGLPPAVAVGDAVYHERQFEEYLKDHPGLAFAASSYWVRKLQARFFAADYTSAIDAAGQAQPLLWITTDLFEAADYHFYAALTRAAVWNAASAVERTSHRAALLAHHAPLVRWAENCPENFTDRATLVAAEIAGIDGRELDAERLYEEAIRLAREHSFIQNEGVANELAARFYAARGYETIANAYLRNARSCYLRWGADGKVRLLDQTYPHLRQEPASRRSDSTIGTPIEQLDLATVVKVSQAVSSEVDLKKLIDTLMVTALEHAGGDRSLLILPHGGELWIEAEATTGRDTVDVLLRPRVVMPSELPESMLYFVIRTQESVVLDDASAPNQFSADEYIRERHSRSVLCLPLVKQASLVGVLYLENSLAPHVFTPARIAVLKLLASQAAISLENAHLYTNAQKMEAYLEAAQRLSHTGSFGWRPATGEILWSEETYRIVGYDPGIRPTIDLVFQRIHPEDIDRVQEALDRAVQDRTDLDFEHRLLMTDGAVKYVRVVGHPSKEDKSGNLEFVGAVTDITERKQLEGQLLEGQERFRLLSESSLTGIYLIQEGRFRYVNPVMARMFGYKIEEVVDRLGPLDLTYPDDRHIVGENIRRRVEGDLEEVRYEFRGLRRDGSVFYIEVHGRRIEHGGKIGVIGTLVDITERKQAEEERRAHLWFLESMDQVNRSIQGTNDLEQMMSDVLDAVLSIFNCDRAWLVYPCDPEAASWKVPMEHTRPEFPGAFALGLDLPLDPEIAKVFQTVRASSTPVRFGPASEHPLPVEVAKRFSIQSIIAMAIYPKRDKPYMLGLHQCSYPRAWTPQEERLFQEIGRRLEDALTSLLMFRNLGESEHKLEQAQRLTHVGYWERNADTDLITWADETYRIFGLPSQGQILNLAQLSELIHPEDKQIMVQALAEALGGGPRYDVEYRVIRPNGEVRLVHSQGDITKDESGRPRRIFGTIQDITERKRAEQRLVVQHTVTQMLAEAATLPEATPKILQTVCEFLLWDLGVLWSIDQEAGMLRCVEVWHKESVEAPQFEAICRERTFMRGIGLPGRVWSSREPAYIPDVIHDANFPRGPIAAREGLHAAFGFPILLGGDVLGVMEFFSHEIRQPEQELLNMMATIGSQIGQFIEGKRAEERLHKAQAELAHVTRVTTLGEMTASIAHEINQPLAAVVNNASACLRWLAAHNLEEARQSAALIIADGHRAGKIISGIRALAKNAPPQKDWVNINETILEVIALTRNEVQGNRVALQTELSDELPPVLGDRIQLQQVILNLVMNGIEAMSAVMNRSRDLHIRSRRHESDKVLVEVQDSGAGLEVESLDRLFTAFFTTKPKGMGMGLAISRSIIEAHGGRLWAAPNDGAGATFQFTLHVGIKEERPLIA